MSQQRRIQNVLVADEHHLYRSGLRTVLGEESDLNVVAEASTVPEALLKGRLMKPDVVVMSASLLAGSSGPEREQVHNWAKQTAFVLVGDEIADPTEAVPVGIEAQASIPKTTSASRIRDAVRLAATREAVSAGFGTTGPDLRALADAHETHSCRLTSREQEIVKLLAEGRTVRQTAAELALSAKTVDAHKLNAMRKLDIHNRQKLIEYAVSQRLIPAVR